MNNKTDRTLDVVFSRFRVFFVHNILKAEPKGVPSMVCSTFHALNSFGLLSQGYCERNPLNLEKTTSSIISAIVNYSLCL